MDQHAEHLHGHQNDVQKEEKELENRQIELNLVPAI